MISSRNRLVASTLSVISFLTLSYFSWMLSFAASTNGTPQSNLFVTAVFGFNLAILLGWMGFGAAGGIPITACAIIFVSLLNLRIAHSPHYLLNLALLLTAGIGYMLTRARNNLNQLYGLRSEKFEEEINLLNNAIKEKNKGIAALEEKMAKYSVLKEVAESFGSVLLIDDVAALIVEKTMKVLGRSGRVELFLVDSDKQDLTLLASSSKKEAVIKEKKGDLFDHWILRHRKSLIIEDVRKDFRFPAESVKQASGVFSSLISTSLISEKKITGIIRVDSVKEFAFSQDDLRLLDIIANLAAVAIQNSMLYARTQELAIKDGLTGLRVRRFFMESFRREVKRAARKREHLSLLILDIDHFKGYNDKYGHAAGDIILKHIADMISSELGGVDVAGRYGGEELAVLLWSKPKTEAFAKAEKIRLLIRQRPLTIKGEEINVTASIGVSTFPDDAVTEEELIRAADARLYKAKAGGRDRVCSE